MLIKISRPSGNCCILSLMTPKENYVCPSVVWYSSIKICRGCISSVHNWSFWWYWFYSQNPEAACDINICVWTNNLTCCSVSRLFHQVTLSCISFEMPACCCTAPFPLYSLVFSLVLPLLWYIRFGTFLGEAICLQLICTCNSCSVCTFLKQAG